MTIFCNIGLLPYITSAVIGVMNFLGTVVSLFVIDKVYRNQYSFYIMPVYDFIHLFTCSLAAKLCYCLGS